MKLLEQSADNPAQAIEEEIAAATGRIEELTAQLADIEQNLGEARYNRNGDSLRARTPSMMLRSQQCCSKINAQAFKVP